MQIAERSVNIDGSPVRYLESGAGPPLLLLHGLGHSSTAWRRVIGALSPDRRVIAPDLPGFGGSPAVAVSATTLYGEPEYFASLIGRLVELMGLAPCDAIGHSAGALALLLAAERQPRLFSRIVLVDPAGFSRMPSRPLALAAAGFSSLLMRVTRSRAVRRMLYATAFYDPRMVDEETVDELMSRESTPAAQAFVRQAFQRYYDYCTRLDAFHDGLRRFTLPTLIVWGRDDRLFNVRDADVARRVLPHARIEVFDRCGHCPQIECPDRFVAAVEEFLKNS